MSAKSQIRKDCVRILGIEAEPRTDPVWNGLRKVEERYGSTAVAEGFKRWAEDTVKIWKVFDDLLAECYPNRDKSASLADAKADGMAKMSKVIEDALAECCQK